VNLNKETRIYKIPGFVSASLTDWIGCFH